MQTWNHRRAKISTFVMRQPAMTTIEILALVGVIALCAVMIVDHVQDFVNNSGGSGADPWDNSWDIYLN